MITHDTPNTTTAERNKPRQILCVNEAAGGRRTEVPECLSTFERVDLQDALGFLPNLVEQDGAEDLLVAVWGGDGSIRSIAALLAGSAATLLACPGGTHNHFCRTIGVDDASAVADALANGEVQEIDLGVAGPEIFLNNLSIGWYTDLVSRRERYQQRMPRRLAKISSFVVQLLRTRRLRLGVDGRPERVWLAWAGNGEYSVGPVRLTERAEVGGILDVRLLRAGGRWPKLRAMFDLVKGDEEYSPRIVRNLTTSTTFATKRPSIHVALDGELMMLPTPVQVSLRPKSLRILVPPTSGSADGT